MWSTTGVEREVSICSSESLPWVAAWGSSCYFTLVEDVPLMLLGSSLTWEGVFSTEGGRLPRE